MHSDEPGFQAFTVVVPLAALPILHQAFDQVQAQLPNGLPDREPLAWGLVFELCAADMLAGAEGFTISWQTVCGHAESM